MNDKILKNTILYCGIFFSFLFLMIKSINLIQLLIETETWQMSYLYIIMGGCLFYALIYFSVVDFLKRIQKSPFKILYGYLCLASITIIIRLIAMKLFPTTPISDYRVYHEQAVLLASNNFILLPGDVWYVSAFPHLLGFAFILSLAYRLFGSIYLVGQLFNIMITVATVILFFKICLKNMSYNNALIAALLFAIWPSYIFFSVILATEPLFMFSMMLAIYLYSCTGKDTTKNILLLLGSGTVLGIGNLIRPLSILIVLALVITILFEFFKEREWKKTLIYLSSIIVSFIIVSNLSLLFLENLVQKPLAKSAFGYSLYIGSNVETAGGWNPDDAKYHKSYVVSNPENPQIAHDVLKKEGIERYKVLAENGKLFPFIIAKYKSYLNDSFGLFWTEASLLTPGKIGIARPYTIFSTLWMIILATFVFRKFIKLLKNNRTDINEIRPMEVLFILLFLAFITAPILTEVQARYQIPFIPIMLYIAIPKIEKNKDTNSKIN